MNVRLLGGQVLVEVLPDVTHALDAGDAPGAIYIPEAHQRFSRRGRVLAVGPGWWTRKGTFVATQLEPGEVVLLPVAAGLVTKIGDVEHRVIHETEVLAAVDEAA